MHIYEDQLSLPTGEYDHDILDRARRALDRAHIPHYRAEPVIGTPYLVVVAPGYRYSRDLEFFIRHEVLLPAGIQYSPS